METIITHISLNDTHFSCREVSKSRPSPGLILGRCGTPKKSGPFLDQKSELFEPHPPKTNLQKKTKTKTKKKHTSFAHFEAKSGPFCRFGVVRCTPPAPSGYGPEQICLHNFISHLHKNFVGYNTTNPINLNFIRSTLIAWYVQTIVFTSSLKYLRCQHLNIQLQRLLSL